MSLEEPSEGRDTEKGRKTEHRHKKGSKGRKKNGESSVTKQLFLMSDDN
jgi:hypothetical protein